MALDVTAAPHAVAAAARLSPRREIPSGAMVEVEHRIVDVGGLRMHVAERGEGPLVILLHGFPECWYSWRHQIAALADAGFRAVAPDQRGYGRTDRPEAIDRYTLLHLVGDVVGLIGALGAERAIVVGHDWGAPVAWHMALLRPDRVAGVAGLSVPFTPRMPVSPMRGWREAFGDRFYQVYFQEPGVAERELEADTRETMRRLLVGASGDRPPPAADVERLPPGVLPEGGGFLDVLRAGDELPAWLSEDDLDVYAGEFSRTGFAGGLNWYRNQDRNWELLAPWQGAQVGPPALYVYGERDPVVDFPGMDRLLSNLGAFVADLRDSVPVPGCGHWTQQERPEEVNGRLVAFCRDATDA
jgi:pimeloyl-ACP methyl ester carboxylesterase